MIVLEFLGWLFILYWIHRAAHTFKWLKYFHNDHHAVINRAIKRNERQKWHWNNLFLVNDNLKSTVDLWLSEVLPTVMYSLIVGTPWILVYYIWAAFLQESLEHKVGLNLPILTAGDWHLRHHKYPSTNFSLFVPFWDRVFKTNNE